MITESNVKLNVSKMNVLKDVFAKQKDSNSRFLNCVFFDGDGRRFIPITQGDVVINAERSDGLYHSFVGSINSDGSVRVPLTNWMLDKAGDLTCSVTIYEGSEKLTTAAFRIFVEKAENPDGAISPDDPSTDVAQQLVLRAESAAAQAEEAVETIDSAFDGAGIDSTTYTMRFGGEFSVTTEQIEQYDSPYALASVKGRLPQNYLYRVTFDGVQYILPVSLIAYPINEALKVCEYIGKLSLRSQEDAEGQTHVDPDVSFLILSDRDNNSSIEIFTEVAGEHTFSIERVEFTGTMFPRFLMYGGQYFPIEFIVDTSTYTGVSIGANKLLKYREAIAIGNGNTIDGEFSHAIGTGNMLGNGADDAIGRNNIITGRWAMAIGSNNSITGERAHVFGTRNTASGQNGYAFGRYNDASGVMGQALGYKNTVSGKFATAIGNGSLANHLSQYAIGSYNEADPSEAAADERGNYLEIVGNGVDADNRSNARTLDWNGNESLAGSITLGKGTADEMTLTAADLKRLIALLS